MAACRYSSLLQTHIRTMAYAGRISQSHCGVSFLRCSAHRVGASEPLLCTRGLAFLSSAIKVPRLSLPQSRKDILKCHPVTWCVCRSYAKKGKDKGGKAHKKVMLSQEQLEGLLDKEKLHAEFDHALADLKDKFIHQLTVRTSQGVFDNLVVKTPDGNFPLIQLGQVIQKSPQMVAVNLAASPQYIGNVKEALQGSGLNINPQQDGTSLFIPLPKITREHRENLAKNAKMLSEKTKKQMRDIYSKYSRKIKSSKEGHSSDDVKAADDMVKDLMHTMVRQVEEMTTAKQHELQGGK